MSATLASPPTAGTVERPAQLAAAPQSAAEANTFNRSSRWILGAAAVGFLLKLIISYCTFGTNDTFTFYAFARSLSDHGLAWTYQRGTIWLSSSSIFNHPPLTAYFLRFIYYLGHTEFCRVNGLSFPFLLRLPGAIADFIVVILLLRMVRLDARLRRCEWALGLLALSPVSLMVTGFHGNTDPVMVLLLVSACHMGLRRRPWLCGLFFGLSCQVKIVPVLFFPMFLFFWMHRRALLAFLIPFIVVSIALCSEALLHFPGLFIKNVISYGSYWGIWGISYWLRLTGLRDFNWIWYEGFSPVQAAIVGLLKAAIVLTVFVVAWRRRALDGAGLIGSVAIGWVAFFILSPGVCAQYMVWLAPFILFLSPSFYVAVTATSALFLFFFYNTIAHGLPWYFAVSTNQLTAVWTPWTVWPWSALILGSILIWKNSKTSDPSLKFFSIATLWPGSADAAFRYGRSATAI